MRQSLQNREPWVIKQRTRSRAAQFLPLKDGLAAVHPCPFGQSFRGAVMDRSLVTPSKYGDLRLVGAFSPVSYAISMSVVHDRLNFCISTRYRKKVFFGVSEVKGISGVSVVAGWL